MRSTIDFFQSSFSEFLAANPSRIAATSTALAGAAGAAVGGAAAGAAAGCAPAVGGAAGCAPAVDGAVAGTPEAAPVTAAVVPEWLNIFDIRLLSKPMTGPFYLLLVWLLLFRCD